MKFRATHCRIVGAKAKTESIDCWSRETMIFYELIEGFPQSSRMLRWINLERFLFNYASAYWAQSFMRKGRGKDDQKLGENSDLFRSTTIACYISSVEFNNENFLSQFGHNLFVDPHFKRFIVCAIVCLCEQMCACMYICVLASCGWLPWLPNGPWNGPNGCRIRTHTFTTHTIIHFWMCWNELGNEGRWLLICWCLVSLTQ